MSISIISTPGYLEPAFQNTIPFNVQSTLATQSNFRYIFEVYTTNGVTNQFKTRVNPFPRPDASGLYSPHYVLRDSLSYKLQPAITIPTANTQSIVTYYFRVGEEWNPMKTWYDTEWKGGPLGLTFSTPHGFQEGDILLLDKTDKSLNPQYDGTCSVVTVVNAYDIITDKTFGQSSTAEGGEVTDVLRMSYTSSQYRAFNGTRQYEELSLNFTNDYVCDGSTASFLTKFEGNKRIYISDYQTLSYIAATQGITPTHAVFKFYTSTLDPTGGIVGTYGMPVSVSSTQKRVDVPTGFLNAGLNGDANLTFPMALAFASTNQNGLYSVQMATWSSYPSGSPTYLSNPFTYSVTGFGDTGAINSCQSPTNREYKLIQIAFLNKLGAFEYLTFGLVSKRSIKVDRKKYKRVLAYNYTTGDRGNTIFDAGVTEEMSLQSDWLTDQESLQVADLISSPEVYIVGEFDPLVSTSIFSTDSTIKPVIVTNDSYTVKTTLNDQLFNFNLTIEMAYTIYTNI